MFKYVLTVSLFLLWGCSNGQKEITMETKTPPIVVTKTVTKPISDSVDRQMTQVMDTTESLYNKVDQMDREIDSAVKEAIRKGQKEQEEKLQSIAILAKDTAKEATVAKTQVTSLTKEVKGLNVVVSQITDERNEAEKRYEESRQVVETVKNEAEKKIVIASERAKVSDENAKSWRNRALLTWGILGVLCLGWVGLRLVKR